MNMEQHKFFLYARKSTDVEDKQVRSIEDQIAELRAFAKQENLNIVDVLIEKQSAKIPGRPIFGEMLKRVENGEANGILAWHADRLARNSVDGGRIIYLLDIGKLANLKFPTLWFENTPQGKFMLNIVFGQSKYYVDSLSENTKRGLRQKVKRGEYPGPAPIGYINDSRTKTVVVDRKKAKIIRGAFELYAEGNSRLEDISDFLAQRGIMSRGGKRIHKTRATFILSNPFYTGLFRYSKELHEGKYEPMKEWIRVASNLVKIARDSNLLDKKVAAKEIFGSNLRLASRAVRGEPVFPYLSALRAAESIGKIPESLILVQLYNKARTYFIKNS